MMFVQGLTLHPFVELLRQEQSKRPPDEPCITSGLSQMVRLASLPLRRFVCHFLMQFLSHLQLYCFQCPKPVIAAVHGMCLGAGVDLIATCDIRYASREAIFRVQVSVYYF